MQNAAVVRIEVKSGRNLAAKDDSGKSDPYCSVHYMNREVWKSNVVRQDLNPVWDQTFDLRIVDSEETITLMFWDEDEPGPASPTTGKTRKELEKEKKAERDDFLGMITFEPREILSRSIPWDFWHRLQQRSKRSNISGEVRLVVSAVPPDQAFRPINPLDISETSSARSLERRTKRIVLQTEPFDENDPTALYLLGHFERALEICSSSMSETDWEHAVLRARCYGQLSLLVPTAVPVGEALGHRDAALKVLKSAKSVDDVSCKVYTRLLENMLVGGKSRLPSASEYFETVNSLDDAKTHNKLHVALVECQLYRHEFGDANDTVHRLLLLQMVRFPYGQSSLLTLLARAKLEIARTAEPYWKVVQTRAALLSPEIEKLRHQIAVTKHTKLETLQSSLEWFRLLQLKAKEAGRPKRAAEFEAMVESIEREWRMINLTQLPKLEKELSALERQRDSLLQESEDVPALRRSAVTLLEEAVELNPKNACALFLLHNHNEDSTALFSMRAALGASKMRNSYLDRPPLPSKKPSLTPTTPVK